MLLTLILSRRKVFFIPFPGFFPFSYLSLEYSFEDQLFLHRKENELLKFKYFSPKVFHHIRELFEIKEADIMVCSIIPFSSTSSNIIEII
jgi:hypothetical protein